MAKSTVLSDARFIRAGKYFLVIACIIPSGAMDFKITIMGTAGSTRRELLQRFSAVVMHDKADLAHLNRRKFSPEEILTFADEGCKNAISLEEFLAENNLEYIRYEVKENSGWWEPRQKIRTTEDLLNWCLDQRAAKDKKQDMTGRLAMDGLKVLKHGDKRDTAKYAVTYYGSYISEEETTTYQDEAKIFTWDDAMRYILRDPECKMVELKG